MVTPKKLKQFAAEREAAEAEKKRKSDEYWTTQRKKLEKQDLERAKMLLAGDLGKFIEHMDAEGIKTIQLEEFRSWKMTPNSTWPRSECYGHEFDLGFQPKPNYAPTNTLIRILRRQGFSARAFTEVEDSYEYDWEGSPVHVNGCRDVHSLEISWDEGKKSTRQRKASSTR